MPQTESSEEREVREFSSEEQIVNQKNVKDLTNSIQEVQNDLELQEKHRK